MTNLHLPRTLNLIAVAGMTTLLACGSETADDAGVSDAGAVADAAADAGVDAGPVDTGPPPPLDGGLEMGTGPTARAETAYAVDPESGRIFMFYGDQGAAQRCNFVQEFTENGYFFDLTRQQWATLSPTGTVPPTRARASGIWDAERKQFVMFGGRYRPRSGIPYTLLNDTWAYKPETNTWSEVPVVGAKPKERVSFAHAQDGNNLIVFGGNVGTSAINTTCWNDAFKLDMATGTWTEIGTLGDKPPGLCFPTGTFDKANRKFYVFGGQTSGDVVFAPIQDVMFVLDLATDTWSEVPKVAIWPKARIVSGFGYDEAQEQLVLFGGHDAASGATDLGVVNDVWTFDLATQTWTQRREGDVFNKRITDTCNPPPDFTTADVSSPERRQYHMFVVHDGKAYAYGGKTDCGVASDTWVLDLQTYEWTEITPSFTGMTCERSGQDCSAPGAQYCG